MRKHTWQIDFEYFVASRQTMPFAWGSNDCALFAADCVLAITGKDIALPEQRTHTTELQAARLLKTYGGLTAIATAALGDPVPVLTAQVGDVVLVSYNGRESLAICNGGTLIAPGPAGLECIGMAFATACWRVV